MKNHASPISRRTFVRGAAATLTAFSVVSSRVLGWAGQTSPNSKLNLGCIGVSGQGGGDIENLKSENIVALCDVDWSYAAKTFDRYPNAKRFKDYRRMLDAMHKEIDAVLVATPDHTHAVAATRSMKMGKHVFCEKPLAHSIPEVRAMMDAARKHKVITQLGNQGHSSESIRSFCEWIWDGAIGEVREVHAFCQSNYSKINELDRLKDAPTIPDTLDWDLWLGPTKQRPYNPVFLPGKWRGWSQFGTGVVGDWTCHVVDPVFWALNLGAPSHIQAEPVDYDPRAHAETFPSASIIRYDFPARGTRPAVKLTWYDGAAHPARPEELKPGENLPGIGALVIGDKGKIVYGSHGAGGVKIIPESKMNEYKQRLPAKTIPRSPGHYKEWIESCKSGKPCGSNFDYGGPLTEIALLGVIAIRMKGQKLEWDSRKLKFPNSKEATALIKQPYRKGWAI